MTTEGRVKVLDFGLAKVVDQEPETGSAASTAARLTAPGQVAGTILYMSPEQARAQALDPRSDVSSFGVVVYEFLAGRHPFRKGTVAATLTAIIEDMPPDLVSSPDDRFLFGGGIGPPFAAPLDGSPARLLEKPSADRVPGCSHQPALRRRGHPLHRRHGCSGRTRSDARASGSSI